MTIPEEEVVTELQGKLGVWYWNGVTWERVHWCIGVLGIACSAISSASLSDGSKSVFAVIATVCLGILGFANPQKRSGRFLQAYRLLDSALREFRSGLIPLKTLLSEHRRAEEMLNEGESRDPVPGQRQADQVQTHP